MTDTTDTPPGDIEDAAVAITIPTESEDLAAADTNSVHPDTRSQPVAGEVPDCAGAGIDLSFLDMGPPLPVYPVDALPERLGAILQGLAASRRVSLDLLATATWPVLAAAIGTSAHLQIAEGVEEPAIVWGLLVAEPSSSKTVARMIPVGCLQALEDAAQEAAADDDGDRAIERLVVAEQHRAFQRAVRAAVARGEVAQLRPERPFAPPVRMPETITRDGSGASPRYLLTDVTAAGALQVLAAQPRGMLATQDELLGLVRGALGAGYQGRTLLLQAFDGRPTTVDRAKRQLRVPALHLSVLGGTQPDRLGALLGDADDGFAARLLVAWSEVERDATLPVGAREGEAGLTPVLRHLLGVPAAKPFKGQAVRLSVHGRRAIEAAGRRWLAVARRHRGSRLAAVYNRGQQAALRLALVMEIAEHAACERPGLPGYLGPEMVGRAIRLIEEYHLPCSERMLVAAEGSAEKDDLSAVGLFIARQGERTINARALRRSSGCPVRDPQRLGTLLEQLTVFGAIRPAAPRRAGPGRRPGDFEVSPELLAIVTARPR